MESIINLLGGTGIGVVGSIFTGLFQLLGQKGVAEMERIKLEAVRLEYAHEEKLQEMNLKIAQEETEREEMVAEYADVANQRETYTDRFSVSHNTAAKLLSDHRVWGWVVSVCALVRPVLTFLLVALTALIYFNLGETAMDAQMKYEIVNMIETTTAACVSWYFAGREIQKGLRRQ